MFAGTVYVFLEIKTYQNVSASWNNKFKSYFLQDWVIKSTLLYKRGKTFLEFKSSIKGSGIIVIFVSEDNIGHNMADAKKRNNSPRSSNR